MKTPPHFTPGDHLPKPAIDPQPRGCICPPGANLTCESPTCPRKGVQTLNPRVSIGGWDDAC